MVTVITIIIILNSTGPRDEDNEVALDRRGLSRRPRYLNMSNSSSSSSTLRSCVTPIRILA